MLTRQLLLALLLGSALIATPVYAANITVTTTDDEWNSDGDCSLREAVQSAMIHYPVDACTGGADVDTIAVPAGTYTLTIAGTGEDGNATGDLDLNNDLTINGAGAGSTTIQAGGAPGTGIDRVFDVLNGHTVSISGVRIANGKAASPFYGGGIRNAGILTVTDCTFSSNSADAGGGLSSSASGTLTVTNSIFSANSAYYGGGMLISGTATVTNSAFSINQAQWGGGIDSTGTVAVTNCTFSSNAASFNGGGLANEPGSDMTLTSSTFSGNSAANAGGGIYNYGTLTATNSTLSGNSGPYGGGIVNYGPLTLTNSTLSGNSASVPTSGGGIFNGAQGTLYLKNTILANSTSGGDCYNIPGDTLAADTNNLIETNAAPPNMCGTPALTADPALGPLADNGGPTQTFALLPSSPALGAGDNSVCAENPGPNNLDQRGITRPQHGTCDIGAFEANDQPGSTFVVNTTEDSFDGSCDAYVAGVTDCSLREAISYANSIAGSDTITLPAGTYTLTIAGAGEDANATGDLDITDSLTINGAGAGTTIIRAHATPGLGIDRVIDVMGVISANIDNVTIENGQCTSCFGGGLRNASNLTVTNSSFVGNGASGGVGGGIHNTGNLTVTNSTFSGNSAATGGGLYSGLSVTLTNSTFSGNTATGNGGGSANDNSMTVTNSTFSGNTATTNGGGLYNTGTLNLRNTILANSGSGGDCYNSGGDTIDTNINNLIVDNASAGHMCGNPLVTINPGLGALADNGGATHTLAITNASSAYNAGDNAACAGTDQRGVTRPQFGICDIGAYELADTAAPVVVSSTRVDVNPSNLLSVSFTVTFSESVTGVDTSDLSLVTTGVTGASITGVTGSGATRTVTVNTGSGNGTLRLDVLDDNTVQDGAGNPLGGAFGSGEVYTISKTITITLTSVGAYDGWLLESSETSNVGGTQNASATVFNLGDDAANKQYRAILHFNTSVLPDTAVITKATLSIKKQGLVGTNPFTTHGALRAWVRKPSFGTAALQIADFQTAPTTLLAASFGATPVGAWYSAILNGVGRANINRTGTTQVRLGFAKDDNNDRGADIMKFFSGNFATVASRPTLVIEYSVP